MYREQFHKYATERKLTARQYFAFLRLAKGNPTMPSVEAARATEQDYKAILQALKEIDQCMST